MSRWIKNKKNKEFIIGLLMLYGYFFALDMSYLYILAEKVEPFGYNISMFNIIIGLISNTFLYFFLHKLDSQKPSTFLFNIVFLVMYVPISAIYGMMKYDGTYLIMLTICILGTIFLLTFDNNFFLRNKKLIRIPYIICMDKFIPLILGISTLIFLMVLIFAKGFPTFTALNLYNVYEIRSSSFFIKNKYMNYMFDWISRIVLPFLISLFLTKKQFLLVLLFSVIDLIFYLYSGEKVILFTLMVVYAIFSLISLNFKGSKLVFVLIEVLTLMCLLGMAGLNGLYDILIRRTLFLPAHLKFLYYNFFSNHPKIGLGGTLWGSLLGLKVQYSEGIGKTISHFFFNNDAMNSNTGFMAEGFYRFGFLGLVMAFLLLYILLKLIDLLSIKTSRIFTIAFAICPIYMLNDGPIIDSVIFGPLTLLMVICLFYYDNEMKDCNMKNTDMNDVSYVKEVKFTRVLADIWKKKIFVIFVFFLVLIIVCTVYYISGRNVKSEKPCYTYYLEAYFDYDFKTDSIMNYAGILDEEDMVNDVAKYVGIHNLGYNKRDNSINVSPKAKRIVGITLIGKDKDTVSKIAQGYKYYALPKLRDNIGAKEVEVTDSTSGIIKIKIIDYVNDGKPGLIKTNKSIVTEDWDEYLYHNTSIAYFLKQGITSALLVLIIFLLGFAIRSMFDRKIRSPRDIKNCIGDDVLAIIDNKGEGIDYLLRRVITISHKDNLGDDSVLMVPIKIQSNLLDSLNQADKDINFRITENVDKSGKFLYDISNGTCVIIGIGHGRVTDIELINIKEVLASAGANIIGVVIFGAKASEIRRSDEYFGKYFTA